MSRHIVRRKLIAGLLAFLLALTLVPALAFAEAPTPDPAASPAMNAGTTGGIGGVDGGNGGVDGGNGGVDETGVGADETATEADDSQLDESLTPQVATVLPAGIQFGMPYVFRPGNSTARGLDINGGSRASGARLILWDIHLGANQRFVFEDAGDGDVFIKNLASGLYLDINGGSRNRGARIIQWVFHGGANQRWQLSGSLAAGLVITSALSTDLVMDINGASKANGAPIITWNPNGGANQRFYLIEPDGSLTAPGISLPGGDGIYMIRSALNPQKVLDIPSGSAAAGQQPVLWAASLAAWQLFSFEEDNGFYKITSLISNKPLGATAGRVVPGTSITAQVNDDRASQRWTLSGDATNGYTIRNQSSGLVFDINGGSSANGAKLILWNESGQANQRFTLYQLSEPEIVNSINNLLTSSYYSAFTDTGLALDLTGGSRQNGANIELWTPNAGNAQKWLSDSAAPAVISIRNAWSGRALDIAGGNLADGANVAQWTPNSQTNQCWTLEYAGGGYFYVKSGLGTYLAANAPQVSGSNVYSGIGLGAAIRLRFERASFAQGVTIISDIRSIFAHGYKGPAHTRYIVLHDTEGTGSPESVINWWAGNGNEVATHFIVGRDGSIWQAVSMDQIAWHAGNGSPGKAAYFQVTDGGMNAWSIGIELVHVGRTGAPYTEAQLKSLDSLIAYIDRYYGFEATIIAHNDWALSNSDTSPEFLPYLNNYKQFRHH
jgi:hypothetical protein